MRNRWPGKRHTVSTHVEPCPLDTVRCLFDFSVDTISRHWSSFRTSELVFSVKCACYVANVTSLLLGSQSSSQLQPSETELYHRWYLPVHLCAFMRSCTQFSVRCNIQHSPLTRHADKSWRSEQMERLTGMPPQSTWVSTENLSPRARLSPLCHHLPTVPIIISQKHNKLRKRHCVQQRKWDIEEEKTVVLNSTSSAKTCKIPSFQKLNIGPEVAIIKTAIPPHTTNKTQKVDQAGL